MHAKPSLWRQERREHRRRLQRTSFWCLLIRRGCWSSIVECALEPDAPDMPGLGVSRSELVGVEPMVVDTPVPARTAEAIWGVKSARRSRGEGEVA